MAYDWRQFFLPLAAGLDTKADPRALAPPALAVARDVQFDEVGGLQTRYPFASIGTAILGGGAIADCRRIVANGDELLLFTKDTLYSWSERDAAWVAKGTHLAATMTERSVFVRTSEQTQCDRAELEDVVFYAWVDAGSATEVNLAAVDKETGAVLLAPTVVGSGGSRPRLLAMETKVLLFFVQGTTLRAVALDPDDIATTAAVTPAILASMSSYYDVARNGSVAVAAFRRNPTTDYGVQRITEALAISTAATPARVCDGPIAVSVSPSGNGIQIVRANGTDIQGDLLLASDLTDIWTAQAIGTVSGTPVNQIAACHSTTAVGLDYRCHVFWSAQETAGQAGSFETKHNTVDTDDTVGTQEDFVLRLGVASRAFDHDGSVYCWFAFAGESSAGAMTATAGFRSQLQNTYFLYRDDALLVAKAAAARAGGFAAATGHLPNVQDVGDGSFAWCGEERRVISLGGKASSYGARAPRDIRVTFDADEARRCVRLGQTLYITGGQILQYDGEGLAEVGFHIYPWFFRAITGPGSKTDGSHTWKATWGWPNAKGELDRSTTASTETLTLSAQLAGFSIASLSTTLKQGSRSAPAVEVWGTPADPSIESPFYLVTDKDPTNGTPPNCYLANDPDAYFVLPSFDDDLADDDLTTKEISPENGGTLENLAPPAASIIAADQDRIFLAGVAGDPDRVWYSKRRGDGEVASFHDALVIDVPPEGGAITAVALLDETLVVFRETAVYVIPGEGFDNAGGGQNYGPARRVSSDCGAVSAEAVGVVPQGLVFKSRKGWYLLGRGGSVEYIGGPVAAFDGDTVKAVHVVETQHQVRCLTDARMLVWDYQAASADGRGQWAEWTVDDGLGACIWDGTYHYVATAAVKEQLSTYTGLDYALDVELPWMRWGDLTSAQALRWIMALGEYRSACDLRIRVAYDFDESDASGPNWVDDVYWTVSPTTVGGPLLVRFGPSRVRGLAAIKLRLTPYAVGSQTDPPAGEALRLTGLGFEVGAERGLYRRLPAAQKA